MNNNNKMSSTKSNVLYKKYDVFWTVGSRTNYKFVNETLSSYEWGSFYNLRLKQSKKFKLAYATVYVDCTNEEMCNSMESDSFVKLEYKSKDDVTRFWKMVLNKHSYSTNSSTESETTPGDDALLKRKNENQLLKRKNENQAKARQAKARQQKQSKKSKTQTHAQATQVSASE